MHRYILRSLNLKTPRMQKIIEPFNFFETITSEIKQKFENSSQIYGR